LEKSGARKRGRHEWRNISATHLARNKLWKLVAAVRHRYAQSALMPIDATRAHPTETAQVPEKSAVTVVTFVTN